MGSKSRVSLKFDNSGHIVVAHARLDHVLELVAEDRFLIEDSRDGREDEVRFSFRAPIASRVLFETT